MKRIEAIKKAGIKAVETVESKNVDFTNRVTDGTHHMGYTEFSASVDFVDKEENDATLIMYVYIDSDDVSAVEDLDELDWEGAIADADFDII